MASYSTISQIIIALPPIITSKPPQKRWTNPSFHDILETMSSTLKSQELIENFVQEELKDPTNKLPTSTKMRKAGYTESMAKKQGWRVQNSEYFKLQTQYVLHKVGTAQQILLEELLRKLEDEGEREKLSIKELTTTLKTVSDIQQKFAPKVEPEVAKLRQDIWRTIEVQ